MVNQYYVAHTSVLRHSGKVKLKRLTNHRKRGEATQVKQKNLQGSKDHKHHGDFKFQFVHYLAGADHSKPAIG